MTIEELSSVLQMQEEILQFSSFTNADAWELGNLIVAEAAKRGAAVLVRIRLNNGYTVFQYGMDGTNLYHEQWLTRKENTVRLTEKSSLRMYMDLRERGESLADRFHVSVLDLLVNCFSKYLHVAEVPRIRAM